MPTPLHPEPQSHTCAPRAPSSFPPILTKEVTFASTTQPLRYSQSIPGSSYPRASAHATCLLPSLSDLCSMLTFQGDFSSHLAEIATVSPSLLTLSFNDVLVPHSIEHYLCFLIKISYHLPIILSFKILCVFCLLVGAGNLTWVL